MLNSYPRARKSLAQNLQRAIGVTLVPIFVGIVMCYSAYAQDLEDYKGALAMAKREGCTTASIPYPDLRDAAERKQADVTRWCKTEPRSCEGLETKQLRAKIEGIPKDIKSFEEERDRLKSQRDSAPDSEKSSLDSKIKEFDQKIDERKKELDFSNKSLETDKSDADKRIYNGKYCVQARKDMIPPFKDAMSKANSAKSNDANIKPLAEELIAIWERCEKEHETEIKKAEDAISYCEKSKNGDL
ncbi:hypothetical protein L0152_20705 [bacterium]|nr:hypothetical protein [bacterium]